MWNRKLKQASQSSCTRKTEEDSCADIISDLPDHLLLHIFLFLEETAVFQSSVLSRRWHHLWTLVPFPVHIIEMRSYFKKQKADIRERKLRKEENARNTISELPTIVAQSTVHFFLVSLSVIATEDIRAFVLISLLNIILFMRFMDLSFSSAHLSLCEIEGCLKRLRMRDARLTSNANSHSTTKIPMELLFPENYEPRYAKLAKVYGLIVILLMIIISCSLIVLKSKFDFSGRIGAWVGIVSALVNLGFVAVYLLKK